MLEKSLNLLMKSVRVSSVNTIGVGGAGAGAGAGASTGLTSGTFSISFGASIFFGSGAYTFCFGAVFTFGSSTLETSLMFCSGFDGFFDSFWVLSTGLASVFALCST